MVATKNSVVYRVANKPFNKNNFNVGIIYLLVYLKSRYMDICLHLVSIVVHQGNLLNLAEIESIGYLFFQIECHIGARPISTICSTVSYLQVARSLKQLPMERNLFLWPFSLPEAIWTVEAEASEKKYVKMKEELHHHQIDKSIQTPCYSQ